MTGDDAEYMTAEEAEEFVQSHNRLTDIWAHVMEAKKRADNLAVDMVVNKILSDGNVIPYPMVTVYPSAHNAHYKLSKEPWPSQSIDPFELTEDEWRDYNEITAQYEGWQDHIIERIEETKPHIKITIDLTPNKEG